MNTQASNIAELEIERDGEVKRFKYDLDCYKDLLRCSYDSFEWDFDFRREAKGLVEELHSNALRHYKESELVEVRQEALGFLTRNEGEYPDFVQFVAHVFELLQKYDAEVFERHMDNPEFRRAYDGHQAMEADSGECFMSHQNHLSFGTFWIYWLFYTEPEVILRWAKMYAYVV